MRGREEGILSTGEISIDYVDAQQQAVGFRGVRTTSACRCEEEKKVYCKRVKYPSTASMPNSKLLDSILSGNAY
jgi:hypothetical protein